MKYFIEFLFSIHLGKMFSTVRKISERSHRPYIFVLADVIFCGFAYGAGYMDYYVFEFDGLTRKQRKTYITRMVNNGYYKKMNSRAYYSIFNDKPVFLRTYHEYIRRDYCVLTSDSYEAYLDFIRKHPVFMAKPVDGQCGRGIDLIDSAGKDPAEMYDAFIKNGQFLLEEKISQEIEMNRLYPEAVNTIRVVTCCKKDQVYIMFTALRIGNGGKHVDNFNNGGMFALIDPDGVIRKPAVDKEGHEYTVHPFTGTSIIGFEIPHFKKIVEQCREMAKIVPENGLTGWDMCVTEKGIDVVEGNQFPGYDIYQSRCHLSEDRTGLRPYFDSIIYGKE